MYIPTFYAVDMGLGLTLVGIIFGLSRLLDILSDPIIGYLSDQTKSRFGPRKPWVAIGLPGVCLAVWILFQPPDDVSGLYLFAGCSLYYLCLTLFGVPLGAAALELSDNRHERSAIMSARVAVHLSGTLLAALIPVILVISWTTALPITAKIIAIIAGPLLLCFLIGVPNRHMAQMRSRYKMSAMLKHCLKSPQMQNLLPAYGCIQIANALNAGLLVIFITYILKVPELSGVLIGLIIGSTILLLPIWYFLSKKISKFKTWQTGISIGILAMLAMLFVGEGEVVFACFCGVLFALSYGCDLVMPSSIVADFVHDEETLHEKRIGGLSMASLSFLTKFSVFVPMAIAFPVFGALGIGELEVVTSQQSITIYAFYAGVPLALRAVALLFLRKFP